MFSVSAEPVIAFVDAFITDPAANADLLGRTVTGILLGFGPTVLGNLRTVLYRWVSDGAAN